MQAGELLGKAGTTRRCAVVAHELKEVVVCQIWFAKMVVSGWDAPRASERRVGNVSTVRSSVFPPSRWLVSPFVEVALLVGVR